jgi:hypothetical protein
LEADEVAEGGASVKIGAAGLLKMARSLGKAQDEDKNRNREEDGSPQRKWTEELVGFVGEEENAGADDGVDAHQDKAPEADGADELGRRSGGIHGLCEDRIDCRVSTSEWQTSGSLKTVRNSL